MCLEQWQYYTKNTIPMMKKKLQHLDNCNIQAGKDVLAILFKIAAK